MSRVEEQQQKAAAEAERLQKQQDRAARDAKKADTQQRFGDLVKAGVQRQEAHTQKELLRQQGEQLGQQHLGKANQAARDARLARGGVVQHTRLMEQVKSFQGTLEGRRTETEETHKGRVETREEGLGKTREATEERVTDLDRKKEARSERDKELARADAKAEARVNAAIDGSKGNRGEGGGSQDPSAGAAPTTKGIDGAQAAEGAAAAHEVKQIPDEILEALASEVYVGVSERGLAEMRIELKEGVLQGATLRVEADNGKIHLRFEGLSGHAKNLVSACEGDLARRLADKGIRLESLTV